MKKLFALSLVLMLFASVGFAAPATVVDVDWDTSGVYSSVEIQVEGNNMESSVFTASSESMSGSYYGDVRTNGNYKFDLDASVEGDGIIHSEHTHFSNSTTQTVTDFVLVENGTAGMSSKPKVKEAGYREGVVTKQGLWNNYAYACGADSYIIHKGVAIEGTTPSDSTGAYLHVAGEGSVGVGYEESFAKEPHLFMRHAVINGCLISDGTTNVTLGGKVADNSHGYVEVNGTYAAGQGVGVEQNTTFNNAQFVFTSFDVEVGNSIPYYPPVFPCGPQQP